MGDESGKAVYSPPAKPKEITAIDMALSASTGIGEDSGSSYASM